MLETDPATRSKTRRAAIAAAGIGGLLVIVAAVISNPTGSPVERAASSESASGVPPLSAWVTFTSPDAQFSVSFPAQPTHSSSQGANGNPAVLVAESYRWVSADQAVSLEVDYVDYPAGSISRTGPKALFDNIQKVATAQGATIRASQDIRVNGYSGHEFTIVADAQLMTLRAYAVGDRAYQLVDTGASAATEQTFLDSFRLLDR